FENDLLIKLNVLRVPARDVPIPSVYGAEVSGLRVSKVAPRLLRLLFRGFWHRMWWKYVLQSFSAVALMFFTALFLVTVGLSFGIFTIVNPLGPPVATPGTVLLAVAPLLRRAHFLVLAPLAD